MNELMRDGGDCRTAPATPGLLKKAGISNMFELNRIEHKCHNEW